MRILSFTSIRSDYDLMSGLYKMLHDDPDIELGLIVSGAHLSETYGRTVQFIEADGLPIVAKVESLLDSNSLAARLKSAAVLLESCMHTVEAFKPDLIMYPGDREDAMMAALIGAYMGIPTAHFFGGDHATDGNVDNPVRHAISKLSSFHFVIHESHKERLLCLGEYEDRIHVVGNPALDRFLHTPWIERHELLKKMGREQWSEYALMIYHPLLGYEDKADSYFEEILLALSAEGIHAFVSYPNSDPGSKKILQVIERYKDDGRFCVFRSLDRATSVNLMRHARFLIGNSSAGLLEAPIIPLAAVNVGDRQRGRIARANVVFVDQGVEEIRKGIRQVMSSKFQADLKAVVSPYGVGNSVQKAYGALKALPISRYRTKPEDPLGAKNTCSFLSSR